MVAYYAAARHPNKRPLPEASTPKPKPAGPAAPASTTRYAPDCVSDRCRANARGRLGPDWTPAHPTPIAHPLAPRS